VIEGLDQAFPEDWKHCVTRRKAYPGSKPLTARFEQLAKEFGA
jgi:hypothetical protein